MLYLAEYENLLHNVVAGITTECFMKGFDVHPKAVELVVHNNLNNPYNKLTYNLKTRKQELDKLSDICLKQLCTPNKIFQRLLAVQACYHSVCGGEDHILKEYDGLMNIHLDPMIKLITKMEPETRKDFDKLKDLLVKYSIISTGLGNPICPRVLQDAEVALVSVFTYQDLQNFAMNTPTVKKKILNEVSLVTAGVRLFNKSRGKTDDDIEDYPSILSDGIQATSCIILLHIDHLQKTINVFEKLIDGCLVYFEYENGFTLEIRKPTELSNEEYENTLLIMTIQQQIITYMKEMYQGIRKLSTNFEKWLEQYSNLLIEIFETVNNKIAVHTKVIYPLFINLAKTYKKFYRGIVVLSVFERTLYRLTEFCKYEDCDDNFKRIFDELKEQELEAESATSDIPNVEDDMRSVYTYFWIEQNGSEYSSKIFSEKEKIDSNKIDPNNILSKECTVIFPEIGNLKRYDIKFGGFDPILLVEGDGLVIGAKPEIGLIIYKDMHFGFRNKFSAYIFGSDPKRYFAKVVDFGRINSIYIDLLQIRKYMSCCLGIGKLIPDTKTVESKRESAIQTEIHPYGSYIDKNYQHSKWTINKIACRLADLMNKRTVSCQSSSYFREDMGNQTYKRVESDSQTMKDGWTNTATPAVFRHGMRGRRLVETPYSAVSLTLPVTEPHLDIKFSTPPKELKEQEVQTTELSYFEDCLKAVITPHPDMFYNW